MRAVPIFQLADEAQAVGARQARSLRKVLQGAQDATVADAGVLRIRGLASQVACCWRGAAPRERSSSSCSSTRFFLFVASSDTRIVGQAADKCAGRRGIAATLKGECQWYARRRCSPEVLGGDVARTCDDGCPGVSAGAGRRAVHTVPCTSRVRALKVRTPRPATWYSPTPRGRSRAPAAARTRVGDAGDAGRHAPRPAPLFLEHAPDRSRPSAPAGPAARGLRTSPSHCLRSARCSQYDIVGVALAKGDMKPAIAPRSAKNAASRQPDARPRAACRAAALRCRWAGCARVAPHDRLARAADRRTSDRHHGVPTAPRDFFLHRRYDPRQALRRRRDPGSCLRSSAAAADATRSAATAPAVPPAPHQQPPPSRRPTPAPAQVQPRAAHARDDNLRSLANAPFPFGAHRRRAQEALRAPPPSTAPPTRRTPPARPTRREDQDGAAAPPRRLRRRRQGVAGEVERLEAHVRRFGRRRPRRRRRARRRRRRRRTCGPTRWAV